MQYFVDLIKIDKSSDVPVFLQLANALIKQINSGYLRKGRKIPGSRIMADLLGINRMTVVATYEELKAQGWIIQVPRKGTFISNELPLIKPIQIASFNGEIIPPNKIPFPVNEKLVILKQHANFNDKCLLIDDGFPDPRLAPNKELMQQMKLLSKSSRNIKYLRYGEIKGSGLLREILAEHLNDTRSLPVESKNILITRGATMGIYLAARVITEPGNDVIMSEPGFQYARAIFEQLGLNIYKVKVDEYGLDIDTIEQICKVKIIRFVYTVPHHHYPTTVTLSPERRIRLLELAKKYNFAIIEDDYDYDFHYSSKPMLPMSSIDKYGNVVYIGTLTKTLAPSIRIGFLTANKSFVDLASSYRNLVDFQGDTFMELAIAELFKDGTISRHIKKALKTYKERRDHFSDLLTKNLGNHVSFKIPDGGMSIWTRFIDVDLKKLSTVAGSKGLIINDGTKYNSSDNNYNSIRLGFASLNFDEQEKVIEIMKSSIHK